MNIAENATLWKHPYYEQIKEIAIELNEHNLIKSGAGFCWAMSDLLFHRLESIGIKSTIVECELTIVGTDPMSFTIVGHKSGTNMVGNPNNPDKISTHVVLLVEHPTTPLLIDCSISHILPEPFSWVCGPANMDSNLFGNFKRGPLALSYRQRTGDQFPAIHQKSVVDRIYLDRKVDKVLEQFQLFKRIAFGLIALVVAVFVYDFYITNAAVAASGINKIHIDRIEESQRKFSDRLQSTREDLVHLQQSVIDHAINDRKK